MTYLFITPRPISIWEPFRFLRQGEFGAVALRPEVVVFCDSGGVELGDAVGVAILDGFLEHGAFHHFACSALEGSGEVGGDERKRGEGLWVSRWRGREGV